MPRPSTRYVYHPGRDQVYEVYFRNGQAIVVSRVVKAKGQRGAPVEMWDIRTRGSATGLVADIIALCEANTGGDTYADASAMMDAAYKKPAQASE